MSTLEDLAPTRKQLVIDLVREAGHDVSDWDNYAKGPSQAASNPKYCYEWAFEQAPAAPIVNLWHAQMRERQGRIELSANLRASVSRYTGSGGAHPLWRRRAALLDAALQRAFEARLPVRVIVNSGRMRVPNDPDAKASEVTKRELDALPWHVESYSVSTGEALLVRGPRPGGFVDQFTLDATPERRPVAASSAFVRSGEVRALALKRANGFCEFCAAPGFSRPDGTVYLETHHIVSLEDGGPDVVENVAAVCPNHHREAHSGARADHIRTALQRSVAAAALARAV